MTKNITTILNIKNEFELFSKVDEMKIFGQNFRVQQKHNQTQIHSCA